MRIFASWSGSESRQVAELLRSWIPHVIQDAEVYVSSQDIAKGERWLSNVGSHLSEIDFGIVAVTPTNLNAPWIQFEAGALSKSVRSRLIPLLCGLNAFEASNNPLTQFQYAVVSEEELFRVVEQVNSACVRPLDEVRLKTTFGKWVPDFFASYNAIDFSPPASADDAKPHDRLDTIENALNSIMKQMRDISIRIDKRTIDAIESNLASSLIHIPGASGLAGLYADLNKTTKERIIEALLQPPNSHGQGTIDAREREVSRHDDSGSLF
ncbi:TIR domain-containing protein [Rhizobium leguminosarum]|uniref:TIR domain-containing protein n=2 Tax=Rhizobium leguminosarum TaxID=384 RepID=A0A154I7D0_RHILE|nr:TIR domain-containing protein [Rhizobium leguminosarum]KZA96500.1 hypothetical protein A4A59_05240 [Rhizobium leguminosarum]